MLFMGTEWAQTGWWHTDEHHRLQWALADDAPGAAMMALVRDANALRAAYPALRHGWPQVLHEDRPNGVMAFERAAEGCARIVAIVNAGQGAWPGGDYGAWVGGGSFRRIFSSQAAAYGGSEPEEAGGDEIVHSHDGKLWLAIPGQSTLVFEEIPPS